MTRRIQFVVSVDTEEDNWRPTRDRPTVENIRELPRVAHAFAALGLRPTFFTTFAVASCDWALGIVRDVAQRLSGEVGAHVHPWNTPPYPDDDASGTMLKNFPVDQQIAKLEALTERLAAGAAGAPGAFRAGRFGLGSTTIRALIACGYRVDSSVTPFISWVRYDNGPDFVGAPLAPYRLDGGADVRVPVPGGPVVEVPLSAGYSRFGPRRWPALARELSRPTSMRLHLAGLVARLGIVRRVILSPETNSVWQMVALARQLVEHGVPHLHLFFHSNSLMPGLSPFTRSQQDVDAMLARVPEVLERVAEWAEVVPASVSEVAAGVSVP